MTRTSKTVNADAVDAPSAVESRRWLALAFIAASQLMVALDNTIVSIALPTIQAELGISDADRQWVVTAYTLAFGGLLLLGGRIVDAVGGRRGFIVGMVGFALASALGGTAGSFELLVAARVMQGALAALLTPTALSLVSVMFGEPRERARAFAIYGAIAGSGASAGLILGGLLTEYASWRWCFYVNIPVAMAAAVGASSVLPKARPASGVRLDIPGAVLVTGGLVAVVYASSAAVTAAWASVGVVAPFAAGIALLALFLAFEARVANPLLPLRLLRDPNRAGANLALGLTLASLLGVYLFLTYYLQAALGFSPVQTGVAFLPLTLAIMVGAGAIGSRLLPRVPPRVLMVPGLLLAALGTVIFTQVRLDSSYLTLVLPGEILLGLGLGCVFVPGISTATSRVDQRDAGIAAAVVNASQMIGGSIGAALLNTVAAAAAGGYLAAHGGADPAAGLVHGYSQAAALGAGLLVVAAVSAGILITAGRPGKAVEQSA